MTTADQADPTSSLPTSRKVLCVVYAAIAVAALIATWSQIVTFWRDAKVNSASRVITVEALMLSFSVAVLTIIEGRKYHVRWVWLYIAGFFAAVSVAFPLFLIARELRMGDSETPRVGTVDTIMLAMIAIAVAGLTIWA
ncbi:DUF2834 domain-containing protein [Mycobacterium sp. Dal123C01]|uniref:DUF2834 domain-containing protein n=1 Tax=Mycobacterium sp. Dal123C01 TaxID=3457577 RepID=UPI00403E44BB